METSWRIVGKTLTAPKTGGVYYNTPGWGPIATFIGDRQSSKGAVVQFPGAPIINADVIAFLPPEASMIVKPNMKMIDQQKKDTFNVQQVNEYMGKCIVYLKSEATDSTPKIV